MNGLKNRGKLPSILSSTQCSYRDNRLPSVSLFCFESFWRSLFPFIPYIIVWDPVTHCGSWVFFCFPTSADEYPKEGRMKKLSKFFAQDLIFGLSRDLPLEGQKNPPRTLTTEYTFIRYVPERGRKPQPNEGAPRPSCPSGLLRKARWRAFPNHSEISDCYGYGHETLQG